MDSGQHRRKTDMAALEMARATRDMARSVESVVVSAAWQRAVGGV